MNKKPRVVSLFSGAGGMDLGFIKEGFDIVWANDFFKEAVDTYKKNIGDHIVLGDITKIDSSEIPNSIDVVIGGFPCQGFSVANTKRSMKDKRNFLYKEMLRIIKDKQPKYFVAENVKGILSIESGKVFEMIKNDFQKIGYTLEAQVLNAAEYGVPQARERVVIIGNRLGKPIVFPKKTHYINNNFESNQNLLPAITTKEAIGYLSNIRVSYNPIDINGKKILNHIAYDNVSDKFWGRKYNVNQADICDYLKKWRTKSRLDNQKSG